MKKQDKAYRVSKTLRAARKRLLATSKSVIKGNIMVYEMWLLYDPDTNMKYTYCWLGADMYYAVESVCLN